MSRKKGERGLSKLSTQLVLRTTARSVVTTLAPIGTKSGESNQLQLLRLTIRNISESSNRWSRALKITLTWWTYTKIPNEAMCQDFPKTVVSATATGEASPRSIRRRQPRERARPWCDVNGLQSVSKCRPSRSETRKFRAWTQLTQSPSTTCMTIQTNLLIHLIRMNFMTEVQKLHFCKLQRTILKTIKSWLVSLKTPKARSIRSASPAMIHHPHMFTATRGIGWVAYQCGYKKSSHRTILR